MAKKYYAVRKGLTPGIYLSWADCQKNISGFKGAEYKGFETIEEAASFLKSGKVDDISDYAEPCDREGKAVGSKDLPGKAEGGRPAREPEAIAYVDGSYNVATGEYACGVVMFYQERTEYFSRKFSDPERAKMRNVAGEIEGSMCAMNYCLEQGIDSLAIYYDYEGIEKWCTGAWKANKEGTIAYRDFYKRASQKIEIQFRKVKGHSGDKYNDLADKLAKQAIGIE